MQEEEEEEERVFVALRISSSEIRLRYLFSIRSNQYT